MSRKKIISVGFVLFLMATSVSAVSMGIDSADDVKMIDPTREDKLTWIGNGTVESPFLIYNVHDLQNMSTGLTAHYALANNINASKTTGWNSGSGFVPVGDGGSQFSGSFDGGNFTITRLYINRPSLNSVGLFGYVSSQASISNIQLVNSTTVGGDYVGSLAGSCWGVISYASVSGSVDGDNRVGGLAGSLINNVVEYSSSDVDVTGITYIGGLVGWVNPSSTVKYSYSSGSVSNKDNTQWIYLGGLVGESGGTVSYSYSTARVDAVGATSSSYGYAVGGLVGRNYQGMIEYSYAQGDVSTPGYYAGGLVGYSYIAYNYYNYASGNVTAYQYAGGLVAHLYSGRVYYSYATGKVDGTTYIAGLVSLNEDGKIKNSYSTGATTGNSYVGGLVSKKVTGSNYLDYYNYWDTETSGRTVSAMGYGRSTTALLSQSTYYLWDFTDIWWMIEGNTRPFLRMEWSSEIRNSHNLQLMALDLTADYVLKNNINLYDLTQAKEMWATTTTSGKGFYPVGSSTTPFNGTLNGQGYRLSNLFIKRPAENQVGLFGYSQSAQVVNLDISDAMVSGYDYTGGLFGYIVGSNTASSITLDGDISGNEYVGGIAGYTIGTYAVTQSYSSGTVNGSMYVGGIAGQNSGSIAVSYSTATISGDVSGGFAGYNEGTISDSYAWGNVSGAFFIGGLVGANYDGAIIRCYSKGTATGDDYVGGLVGDVSTGGIYEDTSNYWDTKTSGQLISSMGTGKNTAEMKTKNTFTKSGWNFTSVWWIVEDYTYPLLRWDHGEGTEDHPYLIHDIWELQEVKNYPLYHYALANDIDASYSLLFNEGSGFDPIGNTENPFSGALHGCGYQIKDLYINRPSTDYIGLFGYIDGLINNIALVDSYVAGNDYTGGLVGYNIWGIIMNSTVSGQITGNDRVGGIVGYGEGVLDGGQANSVVSGNSYIGGLAGEAAFGNLINNTHTNCTVDGTSLYVGGLIGWNQGEVENSSSQGNTTGDTYVGGFVGADVGESITTSYSDGLTTGVSYVGGFSGLSQDSYIKDCYSNADVLRKSGSTSDDIGGFIGTNFRASIIHCYSTGSVFYQDSTDPMDNGFAGSVETSGDYNMTSNFWDVELSGQTGTAGNATGLSTSEMKTQATFTDVDWDFTRTWHMLERVTYPLLWWQEKPEPTQYPMYLQTDTQNQGWNLVSFNLFPSGVHYADPGNLTQILDDPEYGITGSYDKVMYYEAANDRWRSYVPGRASKYNDLHTWDITMGVWIQINNNATLTVKGTAPTDTTISLEQGWNMVSYPSSTVGDGMELPIEVVKVGYFNASQEYNLAYATDKTSVDAVTLNPGEGYWLYCSSAITWTVEY